MKQIAEVNLKKEVPRNRVGVTPATRREPARRRSGWREESRNAKVGIRKLPRLQLERTQAGGLLEDAREMKRASFDQKRERLYPRACRSRTTRLHRFLELRRRDNAPRDGRRKFRCVVPRNVKRHDKDHPSRARIFLCEFLDGWRERIEMLPEPRVGPPRHGKS
jgi:hypothetical protein